MAAFHENLKIEFTGDITGLSIVINGKTFYKDKSSEKNKERSPAQRRLQKNHSVISTFASCVNKIPVVKKIWSKSIFSKSLKQSRGKDKLDSHNPGKAAAFNKIMAANRKIHLDTDHPERFSQFVPEGAQGLMRFDAILLADELIVNLSMISNGERIKFSEKEQRLTGAAVISPYNRRKRSNKRFDVFPKWEIYNEFNTGDTHQITFSITSEEQELLKKYKDCYFYFTIVTETGSGRIIRYFDTRGVTSSLGDYPVSPVQFTNES